MSPELISAVAERIKLGHSKEAIYAELRQAGYTDDVLDEVWKNSSDSVAGTVSSIQTRVSGVEVLVANACSFLRKYPTLVTLFVLVHILLLSPTNIIAAMLPESLMQFAVITVTNIIFFVAYIMLTLAAMYTMSKSQGQSVSLSESLAWVTKHIWSLLWISVLLTAVVLGGFLFFVVPGIILSISLLFSQFLYIFEGKKGLSALLRSRDLVQGYWWKIVWRFVLVNAVIFILTLVFILLFEIIGRALDVSWVSVGAEYVAGAISSLVSLHVIMQLCKDLRTIKPAIVADTELKGKWMYQALAGLGGVALGSLMVTVGFFAVVAPQDMASDFFGQTAVYEEEIADCDADECVDTQDPKERANQLRNGVLAD
jgi:hypothetical protein